MNPTRIAEKGWEVSGVCDVNSQHITINPSHHVVIILIHEILHRLNPHWSEQYVRNRASWLKNRLTDEEVQQLYTEYSARARKLKKPKRLDDYS